MRLVLLLVLASVSLHAQERARPSCVAENRPYVVVRAEKSGKVEEHDNWTVTCRLKQGDKVLKEERLPLAYGASFAEAMQAIEEWQKKYLKKAGAPG